MPCLPVEGAGVRTAADLEDEEGTGADQREAHRVIERDTLAEIEHRERREQRQRDHLLHGLELGRRIDRAAPPVGRHGEAVFDEKRCPSSPPPATAADR
jgi:hypothetical protein